MQKQVYYCGPTEDNWKKLATAVIVQAVRDYEQILKTESASEKSVYAMERFLNSEWCNALVSLGSGMECDFAKGEIALIIKNMLMKQGKFKCRRPK